MSEKAEHYTRGYLRDMERLENWIKSNKVSKDLARFAIDRTTRDLERVLKVGSINQGMMADVKIWQDQIEKAYIHHFGKEGKP